MIPNRNEVSYIDIRSSRADVENFLSKVRFLLQNTSKFILIKKRFTEKSNPKYTTETCMLELEYDNQDVINEICSLSLLHYTTTIFDDKGRDTKPLFVFIKEIQKRQVYIKLRLKETNNDEKVVCISFHFAEHEVNTFPYT